MLQNQTHEPTQNNLPPYSHLQHPPPPEAPQAPNQAYQATVDRHLILSYKLEAETLRMQASMDRHKMLTFKLENENLKTENERLVKRLNGNNGGGAGGSISSSATSLVTQSSVGSLNNGTVGGNWNGERGLGSRRGSEVGFTGLGLGTRRASGADNGLGLGRGGVVTVNYGGGVAVVDAGWQALVNDQLRLSYQLEAATLRRDLNNHLKSIASTEPASDSQKIVDSHYLQSYILQTQSIQTQLDNTEARVAQQQVVNDHLTLSYQLQAETLKIQMEKEREQMEWQKVCDEHLRMSYVLENITLKKIVGLEPRVETLATSSKAGAAESTRNLPKRAVPELKPTVFYRGQGKLHV
jgi:hypothetical protein